MYSAYNSCTEKAPLLAAPKEEDRLKVWRLAIPRKDREFVSCKQQIMFVKNILMRYISPNSGKRYTKDMFLYVRQGGLLWQKTPSQQYFQAAQAT